MSDLSVSADEQARRKAEAQAMVDFVQASPSPFHAVEDVARRLDAAGFVEVDESAAPGPITAGAGGYIRRGGAIAAWRAGTQAPASAGFRVAAAHTDSPNLRIKPKPDVSSEGYRQLGVEVYGGVLLATWADRDLGVSGSVIVQTPDGPKQRLFRYDRPIARIANLAIHLNRGVNKDGLKLNAQKHLAPIIGLGEGDSFADWLCAQLGVQSVVAWELGLHDLHVPTIGGIDDEFIFAPRLDNLACCQTITQAFIGSQAAPHTQVMALFDHEEIGSRSYRGAMGPLLKDLLSRIERDHERKAEGGMQRASANSWMVSCDMAHGVHPNYAAKHEPQHKPVLGGGPVLKAHAEQRYATEASTAARFRAACDAAGVPCQDFVSRTDLACGSTVGPMIAADLGIRTVDIGMAQLSMHSIREQCGADDPAQMISVLTHIFEEG
jgi:aspartyl aminopeptidase